MNASQVHTKASLSCCLSLAAICSGRTNNLIFEYSFCPYRIQNILRPFPPPDILIFTHFLLICLKCAKKKQLQSSDHENVITIHYHQLHIITNILQSLNVIWTRNPTTSHMALFTGMFSYTSPIHGQ